MNIKNWADKLTQQVHKKLNSVGVEHKLRKSDFAIFQSRIYVNPDLMIIGYNPESNYETLFINIDKTELLRKSVKVNPILLNWMSKKDFTGISGKVRNDIKQFCHDKVLELIVKINPKIIIAEGIGTYDKLKMIFNKPQYEFSTGPESYSMGRNGRRFYCNSSVNRRIDANSYYGDVMFLIGIINLIRSHPSKNEMNLIREYLNKDLINNLKNVAITRAMIYKGKGS